MTTANKVQHPPASAAREMSVPVGFTRVQSVEQIGALVRAYRAQRGLDQATTAGLAGVGVRFLGDLERGKSTVRFGLVLQVLDRLGLQAWLSPRPALPPPRRSPVRTG